MDIHVYDWQGNERDMAYLRARYGDFVIHAAPPGEGPVYKLSTLRETIDTAATTVVRVTNQDGAPLEGVQVAWYWPDAPADPHAGPQGGLPPQMRAGRAVIGFTNLNGDTGFGMGRGAYFFPSQGQIGPHAVWIYGQVTRSDVIFGLGMLGETNHDHYDLEFALVSDEASPPAQPECPREEILAELARIEEAIRTIRDLIA
jgi:hypothetical protein